MTLNSFGFFSLKVVWMQGHVLSDAELSSALNGFSQVFNNIKLLINFPLVPLQQLKK